LDCSSSRWLTGLVQPFDRDEPNQPYTINLYRPADARAGHHIAIASRDQEPQITPITQIGSRRRSARASRRRSRRMWRSVLENPLNLRIQVSFET
jgi:hypothetical protein